MDKRDIKDKANEAWDKTKGKANEIAGKVRDDPAQEMKGKLQQAKGEFEGATRKKPHD